MPPGCPGPLAVAFWVGWVLTAVAALLRAALPVVTEVAVAVLLVVLLASWRWLPWEPVCGWRRALPVVFLLATLSFGLVGPPATSLPLLLAALANLTFSLGRAVAVGVAVAGLLLLLAGVLRFVPEVGAAAVVSELVSFAVLALFAIALADAVIAERARRAEALDLLARVEELTLAGERTRMARDMHDSLGHSLTAVKLSLDLARRWDDRGEPDRARAEVAHAAGTVVDALADTRRWVRALHPAALDGGIGPRALAGLADAFRGAGVAIEHHVVGDPGRVPPRAQLVVYRVVQESLANSVRHSRASTVRIDLEVGAETVAVGVADDGVAVVEGDLTRVGGFGLAALADRVRVLGGTFAAGPRSAGGVEVRAVLPLRLDRRPT